MPPAESIALGGGPTAEDARAREEQARLSGLEVFSREIARYVKDGRCALFLGAGVHNGPLNGSAYVYPEEQRPAQGGDLCSRLATSCDFTSVKQYKNQEGDLKKVAQYYESVMFNRASLLSRIESLVHTEKAPSPVLHWLARLNFPLVLTTNYDQLFEQALRLADKQPDVSIYDKRKQSRPRGRAGDFDARTPFILKLHGDIVDKRDSIVITEEDYLNFIMRMAEKPDFRPLHKGVAEFLKKNMILFVGYSLKDYNLRLLFRTLRWGLDDADVEGSYVIDLHPDPTVVKVLDSEAYRIKTIKADFWDFVPLLYKEVTGQEVPT